MVHGRVVQTVCEEVKPFVGGEGVGGRHGVAGFAVAKEVVQHDATGQIGCVVLFQVGVDEIEEGHCQREGELGCRGRAFANVYFIKLK